MPKPSKARRSFRVEEEDANVEPNEDFREELRNRRSINRIEDGPIFKSPSKQTSESLSAASTNFFHCLKMAADNKINAKNAFTLQMIDYMNQNVFQKDSTLSKNFQLATCSLDAGTKIYAARVDCVAKDITDFSMVMTMSNKNDGGEGGGVEDEDAGTVEAKKRKIKKLRRGKIFAKSVKDLQLDFTKLSQTESVYPQVGNLMFEAIDSFNFTERGSNGAIPDLMFSVLEDTEIDKPMKIKIPRTGDLGLCPTMETFVMDFELSKEANNFLNTSTTSMTDTPNLSLKEFNESSLEDNPPLEPINQSFDASVMEEGVDAFGGGGYREADLVADRTPSLLGPMVPKKAVHDGRVIQLQGPAFWKYKKPVAPEIGFKKPLAKRVKPKNEPLDFTQVVDLKDLLKKKTKVTLKRETLVKWSSDKITLPFEIFEGDTHSFDMTLDIKNFSLMPRKLIPNVEALEAVPVEQHDDVPTDDFFNDEQFPLQNAVDHPEDDNDSDDEHPLVPIGDDEDAETFNQDLQNLFNSNATDVTRASFMTNIGLDESKLILAPQVIETVLPEWKPTRRFNMRKLEQTLWQRLEEEREAQRPEPTLHQLYEGLPVATQDSATVTTVLYALLNVCNKKGVVVSASSDQLEDCMVEILQRRDSITTPHPAIGSHD